MSFMLFEKRIGMKYLETEGQSLINLKNNNWPNSAQDRALWNATFHRFEIKDMAI